MDTTLTELRDTPLRRVKANQTDDFYRKRVPACDRFGALLALSLAGTMQSESKRLKRYGPEEVDSRWVRYPGACSGLVDGTELSVDCKGLEWVCSGLIKCPGACSGDLYFAAFLRDRTRRTAESAFDFQQPVRLSTGCSGGEQGEFFDSPRSSDRAAICAPRRAQSRVGDTGRYVLDCWRHVRSAKLKGWLS